MTYSMDKFDKRNLHKRTPAEIKEWLKKLPCVICGSIPACKCVPKRHRINVTAQQ
jgi:hypothetical protein